MSSDLSQACRSGESSLPPVSGGRSQDSTHPGELMVRKAPSFRSPDAERGSKKQVLGCHWPCPQLLQATGKPGCLQSENLFGESPLGPLRPLGHQLRWLRQDRETLMSPAIAQINGPSISILQTGKLRLKEELSLAPSHPACEWCSLVGGVSQDSQAQQPPGCLANSLAKEGIPACIWFIPVCTSPLLHSLILEGSG